MQRSSYRFFTWLLLLITAVSIVLTSCSKNSASAQNKRTSSQVLKLNFVSGDIGELTPYNLSQITRAMAVGKWLFEGLVRLNQEGEYELAGAQALEISPSKTIYTFTLRPNWFSDGSQVTAHDYEACWKQALSPNSPCLKSYLFDPIKHARAAREGTVSLDEVGVKALDRRTLVVELESPTPHFLKLLSSCIFSPFKKQEDGSILFNGPYMLDHRKEDSYLELKLNPFFWDHSNMSIEKIKVSFIQDRVTSLALYEKDELHWTGDPFTYLPPEVVASEVEKGNFFQGEKIIFPYWIYLNTQSFPLTSVSLRKALHSVIDRTEIATYLYSGDTPLFRPTPYSKGKPFDDYDLNKGREFFQQALKELNLTRETFPTLKLSCCDLHLSEYLKEKWESALGIKVDLDRKEWNTFYHNISSGMYQIGGFFTAIDYDDPLACLETLASNTNFPKWKHTDYRNVIDQLKTTEDPQTREKLLEKAEDILHEEMPIIWIINRVQYLAFRKDLKGVCFDHRGLPDFRWAYFEQNAPVS